ncbi:MAG: ABC transporter permease [Deltaproteobacteria bacterium]|nr:ABC transporter permease [Deltaproteobacteria bacterium]
MQSLWLALGFQPVILWSDILIYLLLGCGGTWLVFALRREDWQVALRQVTANRVAMISFCILGCYAAIGFLDTLHFRVVSASTPNGEGIQSVLDRLSAPLVERTEKTYSAPFATHLFAKETMQTPDGRQIRDFPRLQHAGTHLLNPDDKWSDIGKRLLIGLGWGLGIGAGLLLVIVWLGHRLWFGVFLLVATLVVTETVVLGQSYHIFGTDKTGQDVLYLTLKSVRTGLIIGTLTTLIVTPFAILCGILAGYVGGWIDDVIQYVYSTLDSIPEILLIAAAMLIFQVGLREEETIISADKRLIYLCVIMGITSWTGLCRLIRAEVLKLREIEYVQAADAFGVSRGRIMLQHLVPNVMHIVLISTVLRFSGLVLAEAVLAYVGIGVDPSMQSWGNMINQARLELARDPVVWWNLFAAFVFMLGLVLPANLFGDAVRDALDPRLRTR